MVCGCDPHTEIASSLPIWGAPSYCRQVYRSFGSPNGGQHLTLVGDRPDLHIERQNLAALGCVNESVHLHRFKGDEMIAFLDLLADLDRDSGDEA